MLDTAAKQHLLFSSEYRMDRVYSSHIDEMEARDDQHDLQAMSKKQVIYFTYEYCHEC